MIPSIEKQTDRDRKHNGCLDLGVPTMGERWCQIMMMATDLKSAKNQWIGPLHGQIVWCSSHNSIKLLLKKTELWFIERHFGAGKTAESSRALAALAKDPSPTWCLTAVCNPLLASKGTYAVDIHRKTLIHTNFQKGSAVASRAAAVITLALGFKVLSCTTRPAWGTRLT